MLLAPGDELWSVVVVVVVLVVVVVVVIVLFHDLQSVIFMCVCVV